MNSGIQEFFGEIDTIRGATPPEGTLLLYIVSRAVSKVVKAEHLLEIGTLDGRSFIPAMLGAKAGDLGIVVDPFEDLTSGGTVSAGGEATEASFRKNCERFIQENPVEVFRGFSGEFRESERFSDLKAKQSVGYASIDGDHSYEATLLDLQICESIMSPDGVIVVDDVPNIEWLSVGEALYDFLRDNPDWKILCAGWNKVFIHKGENRESLLKEIRAALGEIRSLVLPELREFECFAVRGIRFPLFTNRWRASGDKELLPSGYRVGKAFQKIEQRNPFISKVLRKLINVLSRW